VKADDPLANQVEIIQLAIVRDRKEMEERMIHVRSFNKLPGGLKQVQKMIASLTLILLCSLTAKAQGVPVAQANGTTHQTVLSCTPGAPISGVTVVGFNFYKSTTSGGETGTPAINGVTPVPTCGYTDTNVTAGQTVFYKADAQSSTGNHSALSNEVSATTPNNPPPPTLSITSIALVNVNGQDRLQADWTDTNGASTAFTIFGAQGQVLKQGSQTTSNGVYSYAILIPVQSGVFSICDVQGCVTKAFQGL
jgi:hypothetical protein